MFDLDSWVDGNTLTDVSSPGQTGLGKKDAELSSEHIDNLGIKQ